MGGAIFGMGGALVGNGGAPPTGNGGAPPTGNGGTPPTGNGGTPPTGNGGMAMGGGGTAGGGGAAAGMPGMGGGVAIGGMSNATDIKITGSTVLCPGAMPMVPNSPISACTADKCTGAHCVPADQIPMGTDTSQLAKCPDMTFCTPDDYIATQGKFQVKVCKSIEGSEGRCISSCVPQVAKQFDQLPKDVCADTERCAPCFNPIDGTDTKACTQGCDMGPTVMPKFVFPKCGIDMMDSTMTPMGVCVPKSIVPMDLQGIPADTCAADHLCAPTEKAKDLNYQFQVCTPTSIGGLLGMPNMAGQKGGCVPKYLAGTNGGLLAVDGCKTGELCAPCTNPLSMPANAPTGACPWP
jgi:hypothetical protein